MEKSQPIPQLWLNRIFVVVIIGVAVVAGYYYTKVHELQKKIDVIEISGGTQR
jgi:hypothetical protein